MKTTPRPVSLTKTGILRGVNARMAGAPGKEAEDIPATGVFRPARIEDVKISMEMLAAGVARLRELYDTAEYREFVVDQIYSSMERARIAAISENPRPALPPMTDKQFLKRVEEVGAENLNGIYGLALPPRQVQMTPKRSESWLQSLVRRLLHRVALWAMQKALYLERRRDPTNFAWAPLPPRKGLNNGRPHS